MADISGSAPAAPAAGGSAVSSGAESSPGSTPGGEAQSGAAGAQSQQPPATPARLKRVEKVNGADVELEATEEELWAAKRRERAVHDNARKVAEERKKHAAEVAAWQEKQRLAQEDPFYALREKNPQFDELQFLQERQHRLLQEQNRDPRDLEMSAKDREIQRLQKEIETKAQKEKEARDLEEENATLRRDGAQAAEALKAGKLPVNDLTLELMLKAKYDAEELGFELTAAELATETRRMMTASMDNCAENMEGEELLNAFPKLAKKVHAALVARYKGKQAGGQQPVSAPPAPTRPQGNGEVKPRQMTEREQFLEMEKISGRRILRGV